MQSQKLCLKWNNHTTNLLTVLGSFRLKEQLVDVTISCEGQNLKAHKMILSACSPYFEDIFQQNPCQHPIIIMNGMKYDDITAILNFMYKGEVNVSQDGLTSFLQAAEALKVKGLAEVCGEKSSTNSINKEIKQSDLNRPQRTDTPPRKRHRNRKRSLSDSNRSDEEGTSRKQHNREPSSPEIHELSGDESFTGDNSSNGPPFNSSPRVPQNVYSRSHQSSSNMVGEEDEFEVEPSKMLEQTLTTEPASNSNSDNNLRIERIMGNATEIESSSLQEPESPPDIKPIIDFGEGSAGPSENAMMLYNEQSQPGPSSLQDGPLIHDNSHAQDTKLVRTSDEISTISSKVCERDKAITSKITSNLRMVTRKAAAKKGTKLLCGYADISTTNSKFSKRDRVIASNLRMVTCRAAAKKAKDTILLYARNQNRRISSKISETDRGITSNSQTVTSKVPANEDTKSLDARSNISVTNSQVSEKDKAINLNLPVVKTEATPNKGKKLLCTHDAISTTVSNVSESAKVITSNLSVVLSRTAVNKDIKSSSVCNEISSTTRSVSLNRKVSEVITIRKSQILNRKVFEINATSSKVSENVKVITSSLPVMKSKVADKKNLSLPSDWLAKYEIPYHRFPKPLLSAMKKGVRPTVSCRREMVRLIIDHVLQYTKQPIRKELDYIAKMIVQKYPKTFRDGSTGIHGRKGYELLSQQLTRRVENTRQIGQIKKKVPHANIKPTSSDVSLCGSDVKPSTSDVGLCDSVVKPTTSDVDLCGSDVKPTISDVGLCGSDVKPTISDVGLCGSEFKPTTPDYYRCFNFLPNIPDGENDVSLAGKKEKLKELFTGSVWNENRIVELMEVTFYSQRIDIVKKMPLDELLLEWPFLSIAMFFFKHFELLMNFDIVQRLNEALEKKIPELNLYLKSVLEDGKWGHTLYHFLENLCKYFGEMPVIKIYDEDTEIKVIETDENAPDTPYIASLGDPYKLEECCILVIEHKTASEFVPISKAIAVWFGSFYVYNLEFPKTCPLTAKFFQRDLLGIDPNTGSKSNNSHTETHAKVLALADKLSSYLSSQASY